MVRPVLVVLLLALAVVSAVLGVWQAAIFSVLMAGLLLFARPREPARK